MTVQEYIAAKQAAGFALHQHDGVWWEQVRWGYCKPAILFEPVDPERQAPLRRKIALGCTHRVPPGARQSGAWHAITMKQPQIAEFSLQSVDAKRRNSIRKGLGCTEVRLVADLSAYRKDMTEIAISTAIRNERGYPPAYYSEQNDEWWRGIVRGAAYTEFWGAFHAGRMIAYLAVQVAGHRAIVDGAKSMTEFLHANPNDALVYTFLESCQARGSIQEIFYGHWSQDKATLNRFKESFGFAGEKVPYIRKMLFGWLNYPARAETLIKGAE